MKFLQKPRDSSEEQPKPTTTARTARKKKQEKVYDEQVSTFFGAKRPPLSERDPNVMSMTKRDKQKKDSHESAHKLNTPQGVKKHSATIPSCAALEKTQGCSTSAKSVLPRIEFSGRPFPSFDGRGNGPRDPSHYTWSDSNRHPAPSSSVIPLSAPQNITPLPKDSLENEVGHLGESRPFSRGKRLLQQPLDSNVPDQKAAACDHTVQAGQRKSSHRSSHSHAEIANTACLSFGNTERNAKSSLATETNHDYVKDGPTQESSSSLSHLLHECEVAVANPLSVPLLKVLRHDHAQKVGEVERQTDFRRNNKDQRDRTKSKREPPELPRAESQAQDGRPIRVELNDESFLHQSAPLDPGVVYGTPSLEEEFDDSLEMLWDKDQGQAHMGWHGDAPAHERNGDYKNPVISGREGVDSAGTRQWEEYFGGFWKPNRLY
ncbi:hypothetical protein EV356DRAFT_574617 [Viridothelium virens]|uniref:Uncharacterized protein n=1 Tax=Viridothelium virens TaxID=1048519 RepID=A0A6A6HGR7_VIRVR|nr:hypothetical protein EV356DRAFT_574617 [Viridothelium virens]